MKSFLGLFSKKDKKEDEIKGQNKININSNVQIPPQSNVVYDPYNEKVPQNFSPFQNNFQQQNNPIPLNFSPFPQDPYNIQNEIYNQPNNINNSGIFEVKQEPLDLELPIVSIIITVFSGSSYDDLFRSVLQQVAGGRITLYSLDLNFIEKFHKCLTTQEAWTENEAWNSVMKKLIEEIKQIEPDCVLFNFECCSGCNHNDYHFPYPKQTLDLFKYAIDNGNMIMCSDFAVKALINDWSEEILGPNPFIKLGECSDVIELVFNPTSLKECISKQLQMVGQLCEKGSTTIHALGGTLVFGVNKTKADNKIYNLNILTIVKKTSGYVISESPNYGIVDGSKGPIGHAIVKYKNGGMIIVSAGHWIELKNLDVSVETLERVAESNYGMNNIYKGMINEMKAAPPEERLKKANLMSAQFIQQTAPCNYSAKQFQY